MAKKFLKQIAKMVLMTTIIMIALALVWNFVIPAVIEADYGGMVSQGTKISGEIIERTDTAVKSVLESNMESDKISETDYPLGIVGKVTRVVDGDTLDIDGQRIRLALVNTPERGEPGYAEATQFTALSCPVGTTAVYDTDDGQPAGSYNRLIAQVWCLNHGTGNVESLNASLLDNGHAEILPRFCSTSEFAVEEWATPPC